MFVAFYRSCPGFNALLALQTGEGGNKGKVLLKNLQVQLESDIILLAGKYSVLGTFSGRNTFSKIVALII